MLIIICSTTDIADTYWIAYLQRTDEVHQLVVVELEGVDLHDGIVCYEAAGESGVGISSLWCLGCDVFMFFSILLNSVMFVVSHDDVSAISIIYHGCQKHFKLYAFIENIISGSAEVCQEFESIIKIYRAYQVMHSLENLENDGDKDLAVCKPRKPKHVHAGIYSNLMHW